MKNATIKTTCFCYGLMYRSSKCAFVGHILVSTFISLYSLLNVNLLKFIIDALTSDRYSNNMAYVFLVIYILSLIMMEALIGLKKVLWDYTYARARDKFVEQVYGKLIKMPMVYVDSDKGRDDVDDVVWMADQVANMAYDIWDCVLVLLNFCLVFSTLAMFHIGYTLIALCLIFPSVIGNLMFSRKSDQLRRKKAPDARKIRYYRWMLTDSAAAKDVRMYNLADDLKERFEEEKRIYLDSYKALDWSRMFVSIFTEVLKYGGEILFSAASIWMAVQGRITIGEMTLYIGYIAIASRSFQSFVGCVCNIRFNLNKQMERVFAYFDMPNGLETCAGTRKLKQFQSLEFDKVYFKYPTSDEYVLKGVSFAINRGDKVSLVGINGAGKSTIIKIMLGLYEIESGVIRINNHPMQEYDIHDVRRMFSVLFQSYAQYSFTLRENIGLSDLERMEDGKGMQVAMEQSGVSEFYDKFHNGLDTFVSKKFADDGIELSKGQYQRLALCRTYFKDAQFIIFDEPSAALDAEAEDQIFKNFEKLAGDKTGIMISHRISGSRVANKVFVLDDGVIAESGTHHELVQKKDGIYAGLYNLQKRKYTTGVNL